MTPPTEQSFFSRLLSRFKVDPARSSSPYVIRGTATRPAPKQVKMPGVIRAAAESPRRPK
jgi:hypothetical protein